MDLHAVIADLKISAGPLAFVRNACGEAGLPAELIDRACATAAKVAATDARHAMAWHYHYCVYHAPV